MLRALLAVACAAQPAPQPPPDASPTLRGVVNTGSQTWSGVKKQVDTSLQGSPARRLQHPDVNVLDFGADPTGSADSAAAVQAAIASFSSSNSNVCGTIIFPAGTYRFASTVRVKKPCTFQGASGQGTTIAADPGLTAFKVCPYNECTDLGSSTGGGSHFDHLNFYNPGHKVPVRSAGETLTVGAKRKMGPPLNQGLVVFTDINEFYRHYQVTTGGTTDPSTDGPHSFGNDQILTYNTQTANFTRLDFVTGATSGAFGRILSDTDNGTTGTLRLTSVAGTFQAGETITDTHTGSAKAGGAQTPAPDDELDGTVRWKYIGAGSAIHLFSVATVTNVSIQQTSGNGITVTAGDLECPACFSNANGWQFDNVNIATADGHGLYLRGSDSNGGKWHGGAVGGNGAAASDEAFSGTGFNIYDASFLGNTYDAIELYTGAGHGGVFVSGIGGGSTFTGCYVEGSPINYATSSSTVVVVGGGLAIADWVSSGLATGSTSWNAASTVRVGGTRTLGQSFLIQPTTISPPPWRPNVTIPVGIQRMNGGNLYTCTVAGVTASSGGPTGTGSGIVDNTVHWDFTQAGLPAQGNVVIGGQGVGNKGIVFQTQAGEDVGSGAATYDAFEASTALATHARLSRYNFSGNSGRCFPDGYSMGRHQAINNTTMSQWPTHVPSGREFWDMLWIGNPPVRFTTQSSTSDPSCGVWNPGDRIYYAGAAVSAGGVEGKVCVTAGTAGSYSGGRTITCDGTHVTCALSGAVMSTLVDQQEFWTGDYITVNAGPRRHVTAVSADGLTLTLDAVNALCNNCTPAFSAPTFKTFGSISP